MFLHFTEFGLDLNMQAWFLVELSELTLISLKIQREININLSVRLFHKFFFNSSHHLL